MAAYNIRSYPPIRILSQGCNKEARDLDTAIYKLPYMWIIDFNYAAKVTCGNLKPLLDNEVIVGNKVHAEHNTFGKHVWQASYWPSSC